MMMPTLLGPRRIFPKREKCIRTLEEEEVCTVVVGYWEKPKTFHFLFTQSIEEKFSNPQIKQCEKICKVPTVEWLSHCISDVRLSYKLLHWPASLEVDAASR